MAVAAVLCACAATVPTKIAATHVPTWAYDDGTADGFCNGGGGASPALVAQWVTYAESNCGPESSTTKALTDCRHDGVSYCTAVAYLEANWNYSADAAHGTRACDPIVAPGEPETWWLHLPGDDAASSASRISTDADGGGDLLNQTTQAVRTWFAAYARHCLPDYPALMMDDTGAGLSSLLFSANVPVTTTTEIPGNDALVAAHQQMAAALTHADGTPFLQIDNGLSANDNLAPPFALLGDPPAVRGLIAEGAPMDDGLITPDAADPPVSDPAYYATLLDEVAKVDSLNANDFVVLLSYDRSAAPAARLVQQATVMLGYSGDHVVDWADLETGASTAGDLAVWPEEGIVPADPVHSMSAPSGTGCLAGAGVVCPHGGHHDVQVHGLPGVYVREFGGCYDRGRLFGVCAAIVNDTASAQVVRAGWLSQHYQWEIGLSGGDVQSGGTVVLHGPSFHAGVTTVAPWSALLLSGPRGSS